MRVIASDNEIEVAVAELVRREARFATVVKRHGYPPLRRMEGGLEGLLRIVTDQLISLQAGEAIWRRLKAELDDFDAIRVHRKREASLRRLGLSSAKARCFKAVARAAATGRIKFEAFATLPDEEVLGQLTALPGVGPWTADIYLLSALGRADAWPTGDLALQMAAQDLLDLAERPSPGAMARLAEGWRPWRSVAARLLWSHYRGLRGLPQKAT